MLRQLKIKFIIINMALITCVLAAIFFGMYYLMSQSEESQSLDILKQIAQRDGDIQIAKPPTTQNNSENNQPPTTFINPSFRNAFSIKLDHNNRIIDIISEISLDENTEQINAGLAEVLSKPGDNSIVIIADNQFRYWVADKEYGKIIVFLDRSNEIATMNRTVKTNLIIGAASLLLFFFISLVLATWAIKPVQKSWEKQKRFVADASHELRTPLTVIGANIDLLIANKNESIASQEKWLKYIQSETLRMSSLIADLLYLAKTDRNDFSANMQPFNLSDSISGTVLPFESIIFEQGLKLKINIEPDIHLTGEEKSLKQLAIILIDNAIKHAVSQSDIEVNLSRIKDKIVFSIKNRGSYIPEQHLEKIFERFYRIDSARSREEGGSGLGLAIAKEIVKIHKGSITAYSNAEYTQFTVTLPLSI